MTLLCTQFKVVVLVQSPTGIEFSVTQWSMSCGWSASRHYYFLVILWPPFDPNIDRGMAVREYLVLGYVTLIYSGRIQSVSEMSGYYLETKLFKFIVHTILFKEYALCNSSESIVGKRRAVKEYRVKWWNHLSIKNHKICFLRNTSRSNNKGIFRKIFQLVKLIRNVAMLHNKGGTK